MHWPIVISVRETRPWGGNLLMRGSLGTPPQEGIPSQKGTVPLMRRARAWGFFSLCIMSFMIYRRKNQNCKKLQLMSMIMKVHVSSLSPCFWHLHQFIEISICALENKDVLFSNAQIEISINWCMERGHMNLHSNRHCRFLQFGFFLLKIVMPSWGGQSPFWGRTPSWAGFPYWFYFFTLHIFSVTYY